MAGQVPAGRKPLLINMDETAVCLFQGAGKGTVIASKKRKRDGPVQRVSRATWRTYLTQVAFICNGPYYQKYLPQVVVGNEHTLLVREMAELQGRCPRHFTLVRQKSAWNNVKLMCTIVDKLAAALAPFANKVQPILLMDCAKLHWASPVVNKCVRKGVWPIPVPAKLTWLLQPCDTHMFQLYKRHLQKAYQRRRQELMRAGALDVKNLLDCVYEATEYVAEDVIGWKHAFLDDGFGARQTQLSAFRKRHLELDANPEVGASMPSPEQVKMCFPRNQRHPLLSQLFRCPAFQLPLPAAPRMPALPPARGMRLLGPAPSRTSAVADSGPRTRSGALYGSDRLVAALAGGRPSGL